MTNSTTLVLSSYNMGDATEADYDSYVDYVTRHVPAHVEVESRRYGEPGDTNASGPDAESVLGLAQDLWNDWCALGVSDVKLGFVEARAASTLCWEMAIETAADQARADQLADMQEAAEGHWDDAEVAVREGRFSVAIDELEFARRLEAEAGDDSHARRATALVQERT